MVEYILGGYTTQLYKDYVRIPFEKATRISWKVILVHPKNLYKEVGQNYDFRGQKKYPKIDHIEYWQVHFGVQEFLNHSLMTPVILDGFYDEM